MMSAARSKVALEWTNRTHRRRRPETGDTLIEVLLAVLVMGIASTAILLSFGTSIFGSSEYRSLATTDTALRAVAAEVTTALENQSTQLWGDCGGVSALSQTYTTQQAQVPPPANPVLAMPSGYTLQSLTATYWSTSSGAYVQQTDPTSCPLTADIDPSALVTITLATGGKSYNISTAVDDPAGPQQQFGTQAAQLAFYTQPGNGSAGSAFGQPVVAIEDAGSKLVDNDASQITLSLNAPDNPNAQLSGCSVASYTAGIVSFSGCTINDANTAGDGGYTLTASDTSEGFKVNSQPFQISAGQPAQLAFTTEPGPQLSPSVQATGGVAFPSQAVVQVQDAGGAQVLNDNNSSLTLSITPGSGASGAVLSACTAPQEANGTFSFQGCAINLKGSGYSLTATYTNGTTGATLTAQSGSFNVVVGSAAELVFTSSPTSESSNSTTFVTQPVVAIADAGGNVITTAASTRVTIGVATNPIGLTGTAGSGSLSCTQPGSPYPYLSTTLGSSAFTGCKVTATTTGSFELSATATGLVSALSNQFTVAGAASAITFVTSPQASVSGVTFGSQPVIQLVDSHGAPVPSSGVSITMKVLPGGKSGTVACSPTTSSTNSSGQASFTGCALTLATPVLNNEGSFQLQAVETGNSTINGPSTPFTVAGPASQLFFSTSPGSSSSGTTFGTQPVVQVQDAAGDLVSNSSANITLSIYSSNGSVGQAGNGSVGCPTSGSVSVTAQGGSATFSQCQVTLSTNGGGANFVLKAAATVSSVAIGGNSGSFSVAGPAAKLVFSTEPGPGVVQGGSQAGQTLNVTGGAPFPTQPAVTVEDANNFPVTADSSVVVLSLNAPSGVSGALLSNTCVGSEVSGIVTFSGCSVNEAASGYTLTASDQSLPSLPQVTSTPFTVTTGPASQLAFVSSPAGGTAAQAFAVQPVVAIEDAGRNVVSSGSTSGITLSITGGAPLTCASNTVTISNGLASFAGCSTTSAGDNISLTASSGGFSPAISQLFNIAPGSASQLAITSSPVTGVASNAATVGPITVAEEDAYGNPVLARLGGQTVGLSSNSTGTTIFSPSDAATSPSAVTIPEGNSSTTFWYGDTAAASPTITASVSGFISGSQAETIAAGPGSQFLVTSGAVSGAASVSANLGPITVEELDQFGNVAQASAGGQVVSLSATGVASFSATAGGSGVTTVTIPSGASSVPFYFGDQTVGSPTITMAAPNFTQTTLSATIVAGTVSGSQSTVVASPTTQTANGTTSTVTVTLEDAFGDPVANKAVSLTAGSGSSTITTVSGTTNLSGIATFTVKDNIAQSVTYTAKDTTDGITLAATPSVTFIPGAASASVSTAVASPTSVSANGTSTSTITVTIKDANGNVRAGDTVTLAAGSGSSLITTVAGTTNASGVATFTVVDNAAQAVVYTATDTTSGGALTTKPTVTFVTDLASATVSTISTSPASGVTANGTATSTITATIKDAAGSPISNQVVTLGQGSGSSVITTVSGTSNASGVATFTVTDTTAQSVTYTATDSTAGVTLTPTASVTFVAGPASASNSTVSASPTTGVTANNSATSTVTVTAKDANNNPEIGDTITLTAGSGSSTITTVSGTTNSSGVATFTVKDAVAQSVTYTAKDTTDVVTITQTATVTFVAGIANASKSTVVASPTSVKANGTSTSTVTVTAEDANSNLVTGDTITLTAGSGSSLITMVSGTTNSSGQASFTVADNAVQSVVYTAHDQAAGGLTLPTATVSFTSDPASATVSTLSASPATGVTANGIATSTITATIKDSAGSPISNQVVTLAQGTGSSLITTVSGTTDSSGVATFTVTDTTAQTVTYTATDTTGGVTLTPTATVAFVAGSASASVSTVAASPTSVGANGTSTSTVTVTAKDANGNPEIGDSITLTAGSGSSLITTVSGTTSATGVATFTVVDNAAQAVVYTAKDTTDNVTITQTATVTFISDPASATVSTLSASPATGVTANGTTTSTITATIKDATGNPISNQVVTLAQGGGSSVITIVSGTTNSLGVATFTVTDTTAQTVTYTATDSTAGVTVTPTATVAFVAGPASAPNSTVSANPTTNVTANNSATSTITVTAVDANNNPEIGDTITLAQGSGSSTITTVSGTTNSSGVATFTVKTKVAQSVTYTAKDTTDGVTITPTATVTFVAGPASATKSSVSPSPTLVKATGATTSTITVTAEDANGNFEIGDTITLTAGSGSSLITTVSGTTNSSGQAIFSVADNTPESVTYTAKDATDGNIAIGSAAVTFTSDPATKAVAVASLVGGIHYVTVTIEDNSGAPIANQSVSLVPGPGNASVQTSPLITDGSGQAVFTVTDSHSPQSVTFTATDLTVPSVTKTVTVNF